MTISDALEILELEEGATQSDVRQAYVDLVKVWHPDRFPADARLRDKATKRLAEINRAYEQLRSAVPSAAVPLRATRSSSRSSTATVGAPDASAQQRQASSGQASWRNWYLAGGLALLGLTVWGRISFSLSVPQTTGQFRAEEIIPDPSPTVRTPIEGIGRTQPVSQPVAPSRAANGPSQRRTSSAIASGTRSDDDAVSREAEKLLEEIYAELRPASGTELGRALTAGLGVLSVSNGSGRDAFVVLFQNGTQHRNVYIRSGETAKLADIARGRYQIRFMSGAWWDGSEFKKDQVFREFERGSDFTEEDRGDRVIYSEIRLALEPVVGGNARTRRTQPFRLSIPAEKR